MMEFSKRRLIGISSVVGLAAFFSLIFSFLQARLIGTSVASGLILFFMIVFLIGLNWRKWFSFLPVGKASTWLQAHIYVGWFSIVLFFLHTGFRRPDGALETVLTVLFLTVAASGVGGLILSRTIPKRLTQNGGNITYEQIPKMRRQIKAAAEELVVRSIEETKKSTIADFYVERIEVFLMGSRRFFWNHLFGSKRHLKPLLTRMTAMHRYLNEQEIEAMKKLEELVCKHDELDYQASLLSLLRAWLFMHIPLSYSLLVFGAVHGVLAYRFVGG